jgi:pilus assembly protein CpaE
MKDMNNKTGAATDGAAGGAMTQERPVPRISIAVFCDTKDTLTSVESAAADRRLSKAHIAVNPGGVSGAMCFFALKQTPDLLIVETQHEGDAVLQELDQLATVCDEKTKVMVIARTNDIRLYRELARRGISEYLLAPFTPLQLIDSIAGLYASPDLPPLGRFIAFTGARGGAGASTIAHNVAWCIANDLKISTVIVDLDLPFGTAGLNFNEDPVQGIADALNAPDRLDDVLLDRLLVKCTDHLSLFAAPALLDRDADIQESALETVLDQVRASVPCVIVDLPHAWTQWSRMVLNMADEIVIVGTPDLASLRNTKNMVEALQSRRANDAPPKIVINQTGVPKRPEIAAKEFATAIGRDPVLILPFDPPLFGGAANNGQMLAQVQPNGRTAESMRLLARLVTGRSSGQPAKSGNFFIPFLNRKAA